MPDYIYLLDHRLSPAQRAALNVIREAARNESMTVFLAGGAVRDLTSGSPVRDLDVSVQGNALKLKQTLIDAGASLWGEHTPSQTLFFRFPGSVRVEIASTRREEFPKPGKPVYEWATIHEDLRRRDFTVNAMALSLNDGSYGLLMDPTNGVADIDLRTLRLVNNYGFLEDPIRLVRATRFMARLGWQMDERTQTRFENARAEEAASAISPWQKGYELEEIGHEENPLQILEAMNAAGWMKELCPAWTPAKADVQGLEQMHEVQTRLEMLGIRPDTSAAAMELLTAKMQPKDIESLRKSFVRPGFVAEWKRLDQEAEAFQKLLAAKEANAPSATWKLFMQGSPEAILWLALTGKGTAVQNKFKNFFNVWPAARQKVPSTLMLEMRITPELERYPELLEELFYQTIDSKLETEEQIRAFLEPYSPPAPPPPVTVRRTRASKKAAKQAAAAEAVVVPEENEDLDDMVQAPGQEEERDQVARRDIPAVGTTHRPDEPEKAEDWTATEVGTAELASEPASAGASAAKRRKSERPAAAKKIAPERERPPEDMPSPVQAAARLVGTKLANAASTPATARPAKAPGAPRNNTPARKTSVAKSATPAKKANAPKAQGKAAATSKATVKPSAKKASKGSRGKVSAKAHASAARKAPAKKHPVGAAGSQRGKGTRSAKVAVKPAAKKSAAKRAGGKPAKKGKTAGKRR